MIYLTKQQIIAINHKQVSVFGGNFIPPNNFLHEENLDYLVEIINATAFGEELYPTIYDKAGLYMFNIVSNHIFQDGNKRTGLQTAMIFLLQNQYNFTQEVTNDLLISFTLSIASAELSLDEVQEWFAKIIQKT
jgi:death-on-curing protein